MNEHPHAKLARIAWEAVAHSDVAAVERACAPDLVWHASGRGERSGEIRGRDAVLEYLAAIGDAAEQFDSQLEQVLTNDALVAVLFRVSGARSGRTLDTGFILLFRIESEQIAEVWAVPRDQHAVDDFWAA